VFVAKVSTQGQYLWAVIGGGTSNEYAQGIAVDTLGNAYITGYFDGLATFGGTSIAPLNEDLFVAKLNPQGQYLWAIKGGGASNDRGQGIAVSTSGSLYITGNFQNQATFGSTTLNSVGDDDVFVSKLDLQG